METRIEIFRNDIWRQLRLKDKEVVKYNALINKIGTIESRDISHTNTFSLPQTFQNIDALGLNQFNATQLAFALNKKYLAKYYIEDKLLQQGYLVINNTNNGTIQVNFIDSGLDITEKWGTTTFYDLLLLDNDSKPLDYIAAIDEMTNYDMDKTSVLTPLSEVGVRGYNLALFPNNLNTIGDKFQIDENGNRVDDAFNPYQSRPIFNSKAIIDLACESYGYTTTFDPSVDWDQVAKEFVVSKGLNESDRDDGGIRIIDQPINVVSFEYWFEQTNIGFPAIYDIKTTFNHIEETGAIKPEDINGWVNPINFEDSSDPGSIGSGYIGQRCVYVPNIIESTEGEISLKADLVVIGSGSIGTIDKYIAWEPNVPFGNVEFTVLQIQIDNSTSTNIDYLIDKDVFAPINAPAGSNGQAIGFIIQHSVQSATGSSTSLVNNVKVVESFIPSGVIAYDEYGQYISNTISLTHAAPKETIKSLMKGIMNRNSILMNIDGVNKTIKFFSYGSYQTQKESGNFKDWSKYLQKYTLPLYNTDYGNSYAKQNLIGLSNPYLNNIYKLILVNQGDNSKYKDSIENYVKIFRDVSQITNVLNTNTPYFEYESTDLSLVNYNDNLGNLSQQRADGTIQGNFSGLAALENIDYSTIPNSTKEWYKLIDSAVKAEASFLLPIDEIKNLDLSEPIYIEELGGFFIIEEIAEYTNAQNIVRIKLIKLIDNLIEQ